MTLGMLNAEITTLSLVQIIHLEILSGFIYNKKVK